MRMSKAEAQQILREEFFHDFTADQRHGMDTESPVLINWLWQFQSKHPHIASALGGEIHQIRKSLLGSYVGPYC